MENLEIVSTHTTVQGKKLINGNTANFSWNTNINEPIKAINFNLQRGQPTELNYLGNNVITGAYYPETGKFDVQNNNIQEGDFEMYAEILATVREIATPINLDEDENIPETV